jgi:predicted dehydrogenase
MNEAANESSSRRDFLKDTGRVAAASTLVAAAAARVHAQESNTVQVALVGCGGRGTGAAANALSVDNGPIKLVAMADVFEEKLKNSYANLNGEHADRINVAEERKFIGFEGFKKAMECLDPGDVVILATPPAFRWVQFSYAIQRGLNVFMEKPVTVDGPTSRRMFELGKESVQKNLKVGVGLMCRHCQARGELFDRIQNGEIGDLTMLRAYRMMGPTGSADTGPDREGLTELMYQIRNFHGFLWASGGGFSDFLIHNIDECCWMKNAWPVSAKASGGRHYRGESVDQNFDTYETEYTFEDGTKLFLNGRTVAGCHKEFASYAHGTRGSAVISAAAHTPSKCRIYSGHNFSRREMTWSFPPPEPNPYQLEWNDLIDAIREDKPYNEVERGTYASLVTSMGRMAAHTGQIVTLDDILNGDHEFAPDIDKLTLDGPAPLLADSNGKYPIPMPGINTTREY